MGEDYGVPGVANKKPKKTIINSIKTGSFRTPPLK